ncbi:hypothetical protein [Sulfurospirillum cavolei]|uniref:hypothetical protein n=1 Tax=Sulfurospirillum cavolei TaxID=366522 RepID=UPI0005A6ECD2|nr:hypothetical protein [Sulfurospirillum cavolei]
MTQEIEKIFLTWLDRWINPNFHNKIIGSLVFGGFTLITYQHIMSLMLSLKWISKDIQVELSLKDDSDFYLKFFGMLLVAIGLYFYYLIHIKHKDKKTFATLKEASCSIKKILDDNKRIFKSHAPNSSLKTVTTLRRENELTIWDSVKIDKIVPNNQKIYEILESINNYQANELLLVGAMKNHIEAFKEHCFNQNTDYTQYQFPMKFSALIAKYCNGYIKDKYFKQYTDWINNYLLESSVNVIEKSLFGSVLYENSPNDIDVLLLIQANEQSSIIKYSSKLHQMEIEFEGIFKLKLHLTVFFNNKILEYEAFKEKILDTKEF